MKYLILENNLKWDRNYGNINYFSNQVAYNTFLNTLHSDLINTLSNGEEHSIHSNIGNVTISDFKVTYNSKFELMQKNTIAIYHNNQTYFYWIDEVLDGGNSKTFHLELELNYFLTYWNIINNLKNFNLTKGNLPVKEYFDYEFDGGNFQIANQEKVSKINPEHYNVAWIYVYRKPEKILENSELTTKQEFSDGDESYSLDFQYKIFAAPLTNWNNVSAESLMKYVNDKSDGLTYAIKISKHQLVGGLDEFDTVSDSENDYHFYEVKKIKSNTYNVNVADEYYDYNLYQIDLSTLEITSWLELLSGINKYYLTIENILDIDIDIKDIYNNKLTLKHEFTPSPSDAKDTYRILDNNYNKLPLDERYTFSNQTELTIKTNQLEEYKANNPFNQFEYLGGFKQLLNPISWLNPAKTAVAAGASGFTNIIGTGFSRLKMKNKPESVNFSGATTFIINESQSPLNLMLRRKEYISKKRDNIITDIYKSGIQLDGNYLVNSINDIKRSKFNFIAINNFLIANTNLNIPIEILNEIDGILNNGIRIWYTSEIKNYSSSWNDNGDEI